MGNQGQSIPFAAARLGLDATIVVPHGNSVEKNRAMEAFRAVPDLGTVYVAIGLSGGISG
jgi:threonine dehydratase